MGRWDAAVRIRPTAEGWWFLLLLLGVLLAAMNTGNNLLYLLLALLLSLLVLQNILAEWHFRGLSVERRLPLEAFATEKARGVFVVQNHRRALSGFSLIFEEADAEALGALTLVPPGTRVEVPVDYCFSRRGVQHLRFIWVRSSFPFGLFMRMRKVASPAEMLVYPSRKSGVGVAEPVLLGSDSPDPLRKGGVDDFRGLRPYAPGDPLRQIHWPSSAKTGRFHVVERALERSEAVVVSVSNNAQIEQQIARACGQAERHFKRGHSVGLRAPGIEMSPERGEEHRRRILSTLAVFGIDA